MHSFAVSDVIRPEDGAVAAPPESRDPLNTAAEDADTASKRSTKPLFWLSILPDQNQSLQPQPFTDVISPASVTVNVDDQYWQQPAAQTRWPLPEPSTLLLFGAGIFLIFVARRVRFANQRKKLNVAPKPTESKTVATAVKD